MTRRADVSLRRILMSCTAALALRIGLWTSDAIADTPASAVITTTVAPGQPYPVVPARGESWFDVEGYCKVVDAGDLSSIDPSATGVPVFIPGPPTNQWENYRTQAGASYNGQLTLTTCCRPQNDIATLCTAAGATPVAVSRQYGKLNETDTVTATCTDQWGKTYSDQINLTCSGDNGPDGQAQWAPSSNDRTGNCTANAYTAYGACNVQCGGGKLYETVYDSCGNIISQGNNGPDCNTQACCTDVWEKNYCSGSTGHYANTGTCPTHSKTVASACKWTSTHYTANCTSSCSPGSHTNTLFYRKNGAYCTNVFHDCKSPWPNTGASGGFNCTSYPGTETIDESCTTGWHTKTTAHPTVKKICSCRHNWSGWVWK